MREGRQQCSIKAGGQGDSLRKGPEAGTRGAQRENTQAEGRAGERVTEGPGGSGQTPGGSRKLLASTLQVSEQRGRAWPGLRPEKIQHAACLLSEHTRAATQHKQHRALRRSDTTESRGEGHCKDREKQDKKSSTSGLRLSRQAAPGCRPAGAGGRGDTRLGQVQGAEETRPWAGAGGRGGMGPGAAEGVRLGDPPATEPHLRGLSASAPGSFSGSSCVGQLGTNF